MGMFKKENISKVGFEDEQEHGLRKRCV